MAFKFKKKDYNYITCTTDDNEDDYEFSFTPPSTENVFNFVGTTRPEEPKLGDIVMDINTNEIFVYLDENSISKDGWDIIAPASDKLYCVVDNYDSKEHVGTICSHCGAPGISGHKCAYCGGYI